MSVFTHVEFPELNLWLQDNGFNETIGELIEFKGIAAGITNTNYFVTTQLNGHKNRFVLTVFEKNALDELPYFVDLMLVSCLKGSDIEHPTEKQCAEVGRVLAEMHVAGQSFSKLSKNQRGRDWRIATAEKVMDKLSKEDQTLLTQELVFQARLDLTGLPHGVIHGDLFRDNVLFDGEALGGFIDFYYACDDILAYDVAIAVNDWCMLNSGKFDELRLNAFMRGLLRIAALRFWLSRLYDWHYPQAGELTHAKDPEYFKKILTTYINAHQD